MKTIQNGNGVSVFIPMDNDLFILVIFFLLVRFELIFDKYIA